MNKSLKVKMMFKKSTPGTHVYYNDEKQVPMKTVYIMREVVTGTPPESITVTVEFNE